MRNLKKILALVLALAMSMSLVTIANAADFTDEKDISYEEAVDVMTAIGVIEGLDTGAFNPQGTLTREQAAAIICRMMLGSNASALGTTTSSFSDVAATRWSAPYIEYCASLNIVAGNGDGTFNPAGKLNGYAFAKMLLVALGYKADVEGFVGAGWNLKVASMAATTGILNDLSNFVGSEALTREAAAQMALNTLKAVEVEYSDFTVDVSSGDTNVTVGSTDYSYVRNLSATDGNMPNIDGSNNVLAGDGYMQFGEEHFSALELTKNGTARDDYERPANEWTYKNVTLGTYALKPDLTFTEGVSGDTSALKIRNMGLRDYNYDISDIFVNGAVTSESNKTDALGKITKTGRLVEVYFSNTTADEIAAVVAVDTYLAEITAISTSAERVTLTVKGSNDVIYVEDDNANFEALYGMEKGNLVLVNYVDDSAVAGGHKLISASVPETVTGALTSYSTNADASTASVTVDGSVYKVAYCATGTLTGLTDSALYKNTKLESILYLDQYGNALFAENVAAAGQYIYVTGTYTGYVDNRIVTIAEGINASGEKITLNIGNASAAEDVYSYTSVEGTSSNGYAEYSLNNATPGNGTTAGLKNVANDIQKYATGIDGIRFASDVNFVYVDVASDGTVTTSNLTGVQETDVSETAATAVVTISGGTAYITTVFVSGESEATTGTEVIYIERADGTTQGADGKTLYNYIAYIEGVRTPITATKQISSKFCTYSVDEESGVYTLRAYSETAKVTSVATDVVMNSVDANYADLTVASAIAGTTTLAIDGAVIVDLRSNVVKIADISALREALASNYLSADIVYNGKSDNAGYQSISYIFVTDTNGNKGSIEQSENAISSAESDGYTFNATPSVDVNGNVTMAADDNTYVTNKDGAVMEISADLARFLGGLHSTGATTIQYNNKTYTWIVDDGVEVLTGSNWRTSVGEGTYETLVAAITNSWKVNGNWDASVTSYSANLVVDGVAMNYGVVIGA